MKKNIIIKKNKSTKNKLFDEDELEKLIYDIKELKLNKTKSIKKKFEYLCNNNSKKLQRIYL
jgi:hypothetical protein